MKLPDPKPREGERYVNHVYATSLKGLDDRCRQAEQVLLKKADEATTPPLPYNSVEVPRTECPHGIPYRYACEICDVPKAHP